jgi:type II secretory pathway component PulF
MPSFEYKAVSPTGEIITDVLDAPNEQNVSREIHRKGYRPISVKVRKKAKNISLGGGGGGFLEKKIKMEEIVLFTKELVTLLRAGVPMLTALEALRDQSSPKMAEVLNQVYVDVMSGKSFSKALDFHPKVFSKLFVNSIRAGELSGSLDDVLDRMATVLKHDEETRKKVKKALRYPILVISAMILAFTVVMVKVVPNFAELFSSFDMELPLTTKILLGSSGFVKKYFLIIFGIITAGGIIFKVYTSTPEGRLWWDSTTMKIPIIGNLIVKGAMARFTKMFETLNRSGLPILQTLSTTAGAVGNAKIETIIKDVVVGVERGEGIAGSMKRYDVFPPMVIRMIAIGEQSGSLDDMLESVSNHFDMEVEYAIDGLTGMIEPLLTVVMGGAVVIMALGIFLPMWNMVGAIH